MQVAEFDRSVSSYLRAPRLEKTQRKHLLVRRVISRYQCLLALNETFDRRIVMKKITTGVLSLAALLLLTFGTSFGKSMLAGC